MLRRPLVLSLALALSSAPVFAEDLMQTYELARTNDPQLSIAESQRLSTRENAVQARAALLPQINGSAELNRSHEAGTTGSARSRSYRATLGQAVVDLGAISNLRAQRQYSTAADYDLEAAGDELIARTANAYFDVLVALETLAAAEAAEEAFQKQFDYADKRLEVGLAPITDVHEARAQYDGARANTILVRNALQDAYQALAEITGSPINALKALPEDFRPELPSTGDADSWVQRALDANPSLQAARYSVQGAEYGVSTARAGHLPTLDLGVSYNNGANWYSPGTVVPPDAEGFGNGEGHSFGLTLTVPIFSGGATQSRVRQAIASRDIAQDQFEQGRRAIERNTRSAYQALVAGISEVEARRLALVSAQSAYDASQVGLEVGTRTVIDVLINQQNLFSARQAYASAKYNYLRNRLLLEQAAGTLDAATVQDVNRLLTIDATAPADIRQ
ncbi:TolC family outer membrane protein [Luteimonas sp. M1R5S18]|jgi:outer membrane protein|uniref:TolC family outer membrane protein n=1 Tax=Luteimonas rhizosphaericola TaxID=3042024 RepID=A0ABT6JIM4_9GAMM|nr:TolC family outer membrane protein [Luteimonas rhizosphaericola]MDH5830523.1 TolC family outer membrane protein [Luteimonas rhizosphaericola]